MKFKVIKIAEANDKHVGAGAPLYLITSKDHKYSTWTTNAGLEYYALHSKSLQGVVKPLKRIMKRGSVDKPITHKQIAQNEHDFNLAVKAAKSLKGKQRKFIMASLNQFKKDGDINHIMKQMEDNILTWSLE